LVRFQSGPLMLIGVIVAHKNLNLTEVERNHHGQLKRKIK